MLIVSLQQAAAAEEETTVQAVAQADLELRL
jgi:hypothetical protein